MRMSMVLAAALLWAPALAAQDQVALLAGNAASRGNARSEAGPDHPELRPEPMAAFTLAWRHAAGRWRLDGEVRRTTADLAEIGPGTAVVTRGALHAWGAAALVGRRLAGAAGSANLAALAGVTFDRWQFSGIAGASRWRVAGTAALEAELPAGGRWSALFRGAVAAGPSLFDAAELPSEFHQAAAWRYGISVGVARRW